MKKKTSNKDKGFYLKIEDETHKKFKLKCVNLDLNMTDVIETLMKQYINEK